MKTTSYKNNLLKFTQDIDEKAEKLYNLKSNLAILQSELDKKIDQLCQQTGQYFDNFDNELCGCSVYAKVEDGQVIEFYLSDKDNDQNTITMDFEPLQKYVNYFPPEKEYYEKDPSDIYHEQKLKESE